MKDQVRQDRWTPSEFSVLIGVSVRTLKRWHDVGKLVANTLPSGRRFYTREHYARCFGPDQKSDSKFDMEAGDVYAQDDPDSEAKP